jgi:hypothetical protein
MIDTENPTKKASYLIDFPTRYNILNVDMNIL